MHQGPEPIVVRGNTVFEAEDVGVQIFPLKKQVLIKAVQSPNKMVVSQSIHVVISGLKRFLSLRSGVPADLVAGVETFLVGQMPEISVLVKVLNRLEAEDIRRNSYLIGCLCELLLQISQLLPALLCGLSWTLSRFCRKMHLPLNNSQDLPNGKCYARSE